MRRFMPFILTIAATAAATWAVVTLLLNISARKQEGAYQYLKLVEISEQTIDPELWGKNFPRAYDGYLRTSDIVRTRYGGSEAFSKLDADPAWRRLFDGYSFGVDYREERGHAYSLEDQKTTLRTSQFKQPGACLQCHAGGMKQIYEQVGNGDLQKGFAEVCAMPLDTAWKFVKHPIACTDCHDPNDMKLRVTRPGFLNAIKLVKAQSGIPNYDPNTMATRQEMRTFVCGQCHVEYYFKGEGKLVTYPWHNGLTMDGAEAYYDSVGFKDWTHKETGAPLLKAQHPEFELWNQGIHARSGVACADCHMPYMREGAAKVTDHHIQSPLLNVSRACLPCHHFPEGEMLARAEAIQTRTQALLDRSEIAILELCDAILAAIQRGATDSELAEARSLHRKSQWRLDYISAENSSGFHAPQESARILAESIDYARQGQLKASMIRPSGLSMK